MNKVMVVLLVAGVTAAATWAFGWWAPALTSVLAGFVFARSRALPTLTGTGAALGWGLLLAVDAAVGRLGVVAVTMGHVFGRGPLPLLLLTVSVPLLLGLAGGEIGRWLRVRALDTLPPDHAA